MENNIGEVSNHDLEPSKHGIDWVTRSVVRTNRSTNQPEGTSDWLRPVPREPRLRWNGCLGGSCRIGVGVVDVPGCPLDGPVVPGLWRALGPVHWPEALWVGHLKIWLGITDMFWTVLGSTYNPEGPGGRGTRKRRRGSRGHDKRGQVPGTRTDDQAHATS